MTKSDKKERISDIKKYLKDSLDMIKNLDIDTIPESRWLEVSYIVVAAYHIKDDLQKIIKNHESNK